MSGDLFFTIGDILDRDQRPDHLIVEASGIADPAKIAAVAVVEKELRYAGILTIVDGLNFPTQLRDQTIAEQLKSQVQRADFVAVSKTSQDNEDVKQALTRLAVANWTSANNIEALQTLLLADSTFELPRQSTVPTHGEYVHWSCAAPISMSRDDILRRLERIPDGILRLKALLPSSSDHAWEVHVVGRHKTIEERAVPDKFGIVAIGQNASISRTEIEKWWNSS
jgi:G3E family GTPase